MSNNWIEHNGGPQPVGDDVWVETGQLYNGTHRNLAGWIRWDRKTIYRILNQHLIDAKQAEIDALRDDLETWQSVFPHVMPDRLKSDQQLADEDLAAKIDAARLEGIRLGLEAAEQAALKAEDTLDNEWRAGGRYDSYLEGRSDGMGEAADLIRNINPDTIAREAQDMGSDTSAGTTA